MGAAESTTSNYKSGAGSFRGPVCTSGIARNSASLPTINVSERKFTVTVPAGKRSGMTMTAMIDNAAVSVRIPNSPDRPGVPLKSGQKFIYTHQSFAKSHPKIHFSTLQSLPGMELVASRPIVWASQTLSRTMQSSTAQAEDGPSEEAMSTLMEGVKSKLIEKALSLNRSNNAILGVQFQVINDSLSLDSQYGTYEVIKQITVVACGTPCTVVSLEDEATPVDPVHFPGSAPEQGRGPSTVIAEAVVIP
jgi:hypothetical protein